jgi:DNA mismatch endonuclease, patch repair protein
MPKAEHRGLSTRSIRKSGSTGSPDRLVDRPAGRHRGMQDSADSGAKPKENDSVSAKRSAMMARIGQKNTAPELATRRALHRLGFRFRLHRRDLPGTPDIVLTRKRIALLVHGCFWHRHPGCRFAYSPKSRKDFWTAKFARNVMRDLEVQQQLTALGWHAHVIWECETEDVAALERVLLALLAPRKRSRVKGQ